MRTIMIFLVAMALATGLDDLTKAVNRVACAIEAHNDASAPGSIVDGVIQ